MATPLTLEPTAEDEAHYKAQIDQYLAEMKRLNAEMSADQAGIDTLKMDSIRLASETRTMLDGIWATIARIEAI